MLGGIIGFAIILGLLYTLIVYRKAKKEIWNWLHTFTATIISVIFAVAIGITLFNFQVKMDKVAKTRDLKKLISAEASDIIRILNSKTAKQKILNFDIETVITYIQPLIVEEAARSGLFKSVETENMLHLARKIRGYNLKVQFLFSLIASGKSEAQLEATVQDVEKTRKGIIEASQFLIKKMNLSFTPSIRLNQGEL